MISYVNLLREASLILKEQNIIDADIDARLLMERVFGVDRSFILAHGLDIIESDDKIEAYRLLIEARSKHIPLQHLTGTQCFMGLEFEVNENVLVPRQDTECLVEEAMIHMTDGMKLLDMCTGSGCIAISLGKYKNDLAVTACDISDKALEVAKINAQKNEVDIDFRCGDMFDTIREDEIFDVIVSNPPYIKTEVIETLMEEVKGHEPRIALDGLEDGLYFYRILASEAIKHLCTEGMIFLEIGYDQGIEVSNLLEAEGFKAVKVIKDYSGNDRVVMARKGLS